MFLTAQLLRQRPEAKPAPRYPSPLNPEINHVMYAVVQIGGHQYKVRENEVVYVNRLADAEDGAEITLENVLLTSDENGDVAVGSPYVEGRSVKVRVADHLKADKVIVFKKKRRKGYQKKNGFRQSITRLEVLSIA